MGSRNIRTHAVVAPQQPGTRLRADSFPTRRFCSWSVGTLVYPRHTGAEPATYGSQAPQRGKELA